MAKEKNTGRIELRVPPTWQKRVEEIADRKGLSIASLIRMVVSEWMENQAPPQPRKPNPKQ